MIIKNNKIDFENTIEVIILEISQGKKSGSVNSVIGTIDYTVTDLINSSNDVGFVCDKDSGYEIKIVYQPDVYESYKWLRNAVVSLVSNCLLRYIGIGGSNKESELLSYSYSRDVLGELYNVTERAEAIIRIRLYKHDYQKDACFRLLIDVLCKNINDFMQSIFTKYDVITSRASDYGISELFGNDNFCITLAYMVAERTTLYKKSGIVTKKTLENLSTYIESKSVDGQITLSQFIIECKNWLKENK